MSACDIVIASDIPAGTLFFNRYRVLRKLGGGGFGVVYLAEDGRLQQLPVALKFVPALVVADATALRDLQGEVMRGLMLTHENIVRIHSFEQEASHAAVVMEYIDGQTLAALRDAQPNRCFEPAQILPWLEQLCPALDYANQVKRIAHRDLKPANLMLNRRGVLKIADFGISSGLSDSLSRVSIRSDAAGTPAYMSPQQMLGEVPTPQDDIYSLGATLFDLLTGRPPFIRGNIIAQVQSKPAPTVYERREEFGVAGPTPVPVVWEDVIAACLAKDPNRRPRNAGEILARLRDAPAAAEVVRQKPELETVTAPHDGSRASPARSSKLLWALGLAILAGLFIAGSAAWWNRSHIVGKDPAVAPVAPLVKTAPTPGATRSVSLPTPPAVAKTPPSPSPTTPVPVTTLPLAPLAPAAATKDQPFVNSLGMRFIPVPSTRVLVCVWETRVKDFAAFADELSYDATAEVFSLRKGEWRVHGDSWRSPGFTQTDVHPVCGVNWFDAVAFCQWLTVHERARNLIRNETYRLPTEKEWTAAAGTDPYPWGTRWPPAADDANVAGREVRDSEAGTKWDVITAHTDPYPRTNPVGSFAPNPLGVFDLGGNVWEWCADPYPGKADSRILRGGSWFSYEKEYLRTPHRGEGKADSRGTVRGFRVVLALPASE